MQIKENNFQGLRRLLTQFPKCCIAWGCQNILSKKISPAPFGLYPSEQGFCFCQQQPEVHKRKTILVKCQKRSDQKQLVHPNKCLPSVFGFLFGTCMCRMWRFAGYLDAIISASWHRWAIILSSKDTYLKNLEIPKSISDQFTLVIQMPLSLSFFLLFEKKNDKARFSSILGLCCASGQGIVLFLRFPWL